MALSFAKFLVERGYHPYRTQEGAPQSWQFFTTPTSDDAVSTFVGVSRNGRLRADQVHFGFSCREARQRLLQHLDFLEQHVQSEVPLPNIPCWTSFDVGKKQKWSNFVFPDENSSASAQEQFQTFVEDLASPYLEAPWTSKAVLLELQKGDGAFDWIFGHPIVRAAEILAIARSLSEDLDSLSTLLIAVQSRLVIPWRNGAAWPAFVKSLAERLDQ